MTEDADSTKKQSDTKKNITVNATSTANVNETNSNATKDETPKLVVIKEPITFSTEFLDIKAPSEDIMQTSTNKYENCIMLYLFSTAVLFDDFKCGYKSN